jgi:hypothetical protein
MSSLKNWEWLGIEERSISIKRTANSIFTTQAYESDELESCLNWRPQKNIEYIRFLVDSKRAVPAPPNCSAHLWIDKANPGRKGFIGRYNSKLHLQSATGTRWACLWQGIIIAITRFKPYWPTQCFPYRQPKAFSLDRVFVVPAWRGRSITTCSIQTSRSRAITLGVVWEVFHQGKSFNFGWLSSRSLPSPNPNKRVIFRAKLWPYRERGGTTLACCRVRLRSWTTWRRWW